MAVLVRPELVVYGAEIGEGEDFLIERVLVGGLPCYRVRPHRLFDGNGGWSDRTLEILSARHLQQAESWRLRQCGNCPGPTRYVLARRVEASQASRRV